MAQHSWRRRVSIMQRRVVSCVRLPIKVFSVGGSRAPLTMRRRYKILRTLIFASVLVVLFFAFWVWLTAHPRRDPLLAQWTRAKEKAFEVQACKHPDLDPFELNMTEYYKEEGQITCDSEPEWVCVGQGGSAKLCDGVTERHGHVNCTYRFLMRLDDKTSKKLRVRSSGDEPVKLRTDGFDVTCTAADGKNWTNMMLGIYYNKTVHKRAGFEKLSKKAMGINVLIWAFDSVSRMMFLRKMPLTYKFMKDTLHTIVLKGYNVVGDGTLQAVLPILTGHKQTEMPNTMLKYNSTRHNDIYPLIWKNFEKAGYVTGYAEDMQFIGTFTYSTTGFKEQPTDHYTRPFYQVAEKQYKKHKPYCLRARPRHKVMMDYVRDFATMYKKEPYFLFAFHSELSHSYKGFNLGAADRDLRDMLKWLYDGGHLKNTLLIVMSDHGNRFAKIRETQQGKLEERMPFVSFTFPPNFAKTHKKHLKTFKINSERLATPFDMHETLHAVLKAKTPKMGNTSKRAMSLFDEVPLSRTCKSAQIAAHWCACLNWEPVKKSDSKVVLHAAATLVHRLNELTDDSRDICDILLIDKIEWAEKYIPTEEMLHFRGVHKNGKYYVDWDERTKVTTEFYQLKVVTQPGGGHFEASFKYTNDKKLMMLKTADISRVNRYGVQASCLSETQRDIRKYCHCKVQKTEEHSGN